MEQRILQYRKQIDEWLTEMEQNVQTLSQHGEYSTQAVQRQTHTKINYFPRIILQGVSTQCWQV